MPEPTAAEVARKLWFPLLPGSLHCISPQVFALSVATSLKISGVFIPRSVFTQPGPVAD